MFERRFDFTKLRGTRFDPFLQVVHVDFDVKDDGYVCHLDSHKLKFSKDLDELFGEFLETFRSLKIDTRITVAVFHQNLLKKKHAQKLEHIRHRLINMKASGGLAVSEATLKKNLNEERAYWKEREKATTQNQGIQVDGGCSACH